jgi:hypothetical protein
MTNDAADQASTDLFDPDKFLVQHLTRGFSFCQSQSESGDGAISIDPEGTLPVLSHVAVNFVDPTQSSASIASANNKPLELYQKIVTVFEREYKSTICDVPYQNYRSGVDGILDHLKVLPSVSTVGGGMSQFIKDSSDWHVAPYCHVYIAVCESLEHYRNKVKPSIRIFLSQLEATAVDQFGAQLPKTPYMILFVPMGARVQADDASIRGKTRMAAFASRMAAARETALQRMATAVQTEDEVVPESQLSKIERELEKRMAANFPSARVCTLSSIIDFQDEALDAEERQLSRLEWDVFTKELGATIVDGFRGRCRRYDDEIKKLGAKHASASGKEGDQFNLTYILLVKESLAFTYQQMRLHAEALLQYEELHALIPDVKGEHFLNGGNQSLPKDVKSLLQISLSGDVLAFRENIHYFADWTLIAHEIEHYFLVRETALLFGMKNPIGVVKRCTSFVQRLFNVKRSQLLLSGKTGEAMLDLNKWAFELCWDVKTTSRALSSTNPTTVCFETEEFARSVCDILDFARYRFFELGKLKFPDYKPPQFLGGEELPVQLDVKWEPWEEPDIIQDVDDNGDFDLPETGLIAKALSSKDLFEVVYANLTKALATYMESCGRRRYAACLRLAVVDVAVGRNQLHAAERELRSIASTFASDNWNACNFFLQVQLAKLQRKSESAVIYLGTLINCFSGTASPVRALTALSNDLDAVVRCQSTTGTNVVAAPIFRPSLGLVDFSMLDLVGSDRTLLKKLYSVGDTVPVTVSIFSQLPKVIHVQAISVSVVPFQSYVSAMEDSTEIKDECTVHLLSLNDVAVSPGRNDMILDWTPILTGQFILSAIAIQWGNCRFMYATKGMKRPIVRVDVIPCEPTQAIEIRPNFLVPGHEQPLQIVFNSGSDVVESGSVNLVGSAGVLLCAEDMNRDNPSNWRSSITFDLSACSAGHTEIRQVVVKSEVDTESGAVAALLVEANTLFRTSKGRDPTSEGNNGSAGVMDCSLTTSVTTLGKAAFAVDSAEILSYTTNGLVVNLCILCNPPRPFILQTWSLDVPSYISLTGAGDLNKSLENSTVSPGESLSLAFDCTALQELPPSFNGTLNITYDNGAGTTFIDSITFLLKQPLLRPMPKVVLEDVLITLSPSASSGSVGSPIDIACSVDITGIASLRGKEIRYRAYCKSDGWLLYGKTEGMIRTEDSSIHKLSFVAVPTRPGSSTEYLSLSLMVEDEKGRLLELPVRLSQPPFGSFDPPCQATVAFLATEKSASPGH